MAGNQDNPQGRPDAEGVFSAARQILDAAERAAYLERACGGDAALRANVEMLLRADAEAGEGGFLATREAAGGDHRAGRRPATSPSHQEHSLEGQVVGRYKLLQLIGEGGFGAVYMAEQGEPVRRRVALKVIKPGMDSRMVAARFEAERQALALMDHPHIARVFDGGVTEPAQGSRPYFVMEYVTGDPITAFADAHKLSIPDRLDLFTQVCGAVQHAHTKGIIHRDLKPGNVLVSMTDGRPFAKVIDFGIAKSLASRLTEKTLFTEHRQLIGTPEYMSPEQAEGSPDIDTRTDVYALGVLLYELLTGATPFDAVRLRSAAFGEMQRILKEEEPPAPSLRIARDLNTLAKAAAARQLEPSRLGTSVKGELDWIAMKAIDKDRARRYESAGQMAADVRRHLDGEAVLAAPPGAGYRVRKFVRKNRGKVLAGGAIAAAVFLGSVGTALGVARAIDESRQKKMVADAVRAGFGRILDEFAGESTGGMEWAGPEAPEADRINQALNVIVDAGVGGIRREKQRAAELEAANSRLERTAETTRLALGEIFAWIDKGDLLEGVADRTYEMQVDGVTVKVVEKGSRTTWSYPDGTIQVIDTPSPREDHTVGGWATLPGDNKDVDAAIRSMRDTAIAKIREARATNASLQRQRDIAQEAINKVSAAATCDVCDPQDQHLNGQVFLHSWMNGPYGAPYKNDPQDEQKLRALGAFAEYSINGMMAAKRTIEQKNYLHTIQDAFDDWHNTFYASANRLLDSCPEAMRGWEWNFVRQLADVREREFEAHQCVVTAAAWTARSGVLATAGEDGSVRVWECEKPGDLPRCELARHPAPVTAMAFTLDDSLLLTACGDDRVRVWDARTGAAVRELAAGSAVRSLVVGRVAPWCAAGLESGEIRLWNPATGEALGELPGQGAPVGAMAASPYADMLVSGDAKGTVVFWNIAQRKMYEGGIRRPGADDGFEIRSMAFGEDGAVVVGPSPRGGGHLDRTPAVQVVPGLPGLAERAWSAFASDDLGEIQTWRDETHNWVGSHGSPARGYNWAVKQSTDGPQRGRALAVSADGLWSAVGLDNGRVQVERGPHGFVPDAYRIVWKDQPFNSDGGFEMFETGDRLTLASEGRLASIPLTAGGHSAGMVLQAEGWQAVSAEGRFALSRTEQGRVRVWDVDSGRSVGEWTSEESVFAVCRGGERVIEAREREVVIRRATDGQVLRTIAPGIAAQSTLDLLQLSPDETLLAYATERREPGHDFSGMAGGEVGVIDLASGKRLWETGGFPPTPYGLDTMYEAVGALKFDPAGKRLVVAGAKLSVWNAADGSRVAEADTTWIKSLCFSTDGERMFVVHQSSGYGRPSTLAVWRTSDLSRLLRWSVGDADRVRLSPDGRNLILVGNSLAVSPLDASRGTTETDRAVDRFRRVSQAVREACRTAASFEEALRAVDGGAFDSEQRALARGLSARDIAWTRGDEAWAAALQRGLATEQYAKALRDAQFDASVRTEEPLTKRNLGAALYRCGRATEAVSVLRTADDAIRASASEEWKGGLPSCVSFLAMAQASAGQREAAAESLRRLRELALRPWWAGNPQVAAYLKEATGVVEAK